MRGFSCRRLRFEWFAALGLVLAMPVLDAAATQATQTSLSAETHNQSGRTQAILSVNVTGDDASIATGTISIVDGDKPLAGAALNAQGKAQITLGLLPGDHALRAIYSGDAKHEASNSDFAGVTAEATATPSFTVAVNPASLSLTAGQSGNVTVSVNPVNASALTAPMFVTLSCSGLPDQSTCTFTPENVQIVPGATSAITSTMVVATSAGGTRGMAAPPAHPGMQPVAWAILLPGTLGLAGLGFAARRRRWLSRLALIALVALVGAMGTTGCAPLYNYYNHGPNYNLPTPSGSYTLSITAQSSNGITANTQSAQFALTVK